MEHVLLASSSDALKRQQWCLKGQQWCLKFVLIGIPGA
jgi:hypothetical protein